MPASPPRAKPPGAVDHRRILAPLLERPVLFENFDQGRAELERRNGVIRDLVYAFSHDLRTPLIANTMNMRLALEGAFGQLSPEYRRTLENGLSANEDLLELADSLLLVARFESGETLARLEPVLQEKGVRVELEAPAQLKVLGRPAELRRVFQNLLDNAAKFSPRGGVVTVRLVFDDAYTSARGAPRGARPWTGGPTIPTGPAVWALFAGTSEGRTVYGTGTSPSNSLLKSLIGSANAPGSDAHTEPRCASEDACWKGGGERYVRMREAAAHREPACVYCQPITAPLDLTPLSLE